MPASAPRPFSHIAALQLSAPARRAPASVAGSPAHAEETVAAAAPRVLLAEDHEDSREALCTLLQAFGYEVEVARNGREAVEQALALQPDVILMDVMMPEMDGIEATRLLRAATEFRQVPIIALTAMEGARAQVLAAGCSDMVAKPLEMRPFLERLRGWVAGAPPMG